jgi:hypothetical protein
VKSALVAVLVAQLAGAQEIPDAGTLDAGTDAGIGWDAPLYSDCPVTDEKATQVDGGWWIFPDARVSRVACLMETCRAREEKFESRSVESAFSLLPGWFVPTVTLLLGLFVGGLVGYAIGRAIR